MTFDFAPDGTLTGVTADATSYPSPSRLAVASKPAFAVPQRPTPPELAALVGELFHEGCLSWEQMCSLAELPDFGASLMDTLATAPSNRKPMAAE